MAEAHRAVAAAIGAELPRPEESARLTATPTPGPATSSHHEAILDGAPDAMLTVGEDGIIRTANRAVMDLFGYQPAELIGKPIETLVPQRIRPGHPSLRKSFMAGGVNRRMGAISHRSELRGVRKDGSEVPVDISLALIHAGGERLVLAAVRDVTQDLELRAQLNRSHFLADTALQLTQSGYWHVDFTDPEHYYASERAQAIFGETTGDERGRLHILNEWLARIVEVDPAAAEATSERFTGTIEGRYPQYDATYPYRRPKDGRVIWCRALATLVRNQAGEPREMYGVVQDITPSVRPRRRSSRARPCSRRPPRAPTSACGKWTSRRARSSSTTYWSRSWATRPAVCAPRRRNGLRCAAGWPAGPSCCTRTTRPARWS